MSLPAGSRIVRATRFIFEDEHILLAAQKFQLQPSWIAKRLDNPNIIKCQGIIGRVIEYMATLPGVTQSDTTDQWTSQGQKLQ